MKTHGARGGRAVRFRLCLVGCIAAGGLGFSRPGLAETPSIETPECPSREFRVKLATLGEHALYRPPTETKEELQKAFANRLFRKAVEDVLEQQKMGEFTRDLLAAGEKGDAKEVEFPRGHGLLWMAYRHSVHGAATTLNHVCWVGHRLLAWEIRIDREGKSPEYFLVPKICSNLAYLGPAPLRPKPPICKLVVGGKCDPVTVAKDYEISIDATDSAPGTSPIESIAVRVKKSGTQEDYRYFKVDNPSQAKWSDHFPPGDYEFSGEVTSTDKLTASCWVKLNFCEPLPPPKLNCNLKVANDCVANKVRVDVDGTEGDVRLFFNGGPNSAKPGTTHYDFDIPNAPYSVHLTAEKDRYVSCDETLSGAPCQPPERCCSSPWLLRTYALWAAAQGSMQKGVVRTASGDTASFEFGFGDGLGAGFELERFFGGTEDGMRRARWGWTFGLSRTGLNTRWQLDLPTRFILDHERVPLTLLTSGIDYHWSSAKWDVFVGPVLGYALFNSGTYPDDSRRGGTFRARFKDEFSYGANAGFDAFFGQCWGITAGVEYLKLSTKTDFLDASVDPLIVRLGFVYRF